MGCLGGDEPEERDYAEEAISTLRAQLNMLPEWYGAEMEYRPKLAGVSAGITAEQFPRTLEQYQQAATAFGATERAQQAARVAQNMGMIGQYAPALTQAMRDASGNTALLGMLNTEAANGLSGSMIDPALAAQTAQAARAAQAGRGMMTSGMPAVNAEALFGAERANAIRQQNRTFAEQVAALNQATGSESLLAALLGQQSQTLGMSGMPVATAYGYSNTGSILNPESSYAGNLNAANQAYNNQYTASQPSTLQTIGTIGSLAGGLLGGLFCWVAREAYGQWDPTWLVFRRWLLSDAPAWFRNLYRRHGPAFADWLRAHPRIKPLIRWAFDRCIERGRA